MLVEVSRRLLVCALSFLDVLTEYTGSSSEQTRRFVTIVAIRRVKQTSFTRQHHSFPEQGRPFAGLLFYLPSASKAMILMILQPSCRQSSRAVSVSATICRNMVTDQMIMKVLLNVCGNRVFHQEHLLKLSRADFLYKFGGIHDKLSTNKDRQFKSRSISKCARVRFLYPTNISSSHVSH